MQSVDVNAWVGQNVARLRQARGWSQTELASRLSAELDKPIDPTAITRLERGTRPTTVRELAALAAILEQELLVLLGEPKATGAVAEAKLAASRVEMLQETIAWQWRLLLDARKTLASAVERARLADPDANLEHAEAVLSVPPEVAIASKLKDKEAAGSEGRKRGQTTRFDLQVATTNPSGAGPWDWA